MSTVDKIFYLYYLRRPDKPDQLDPDKGQPFYVGKGCNGRVGDHRKQAESLRHKPSKKNYKIFIIHKLWKQGLDFQEDLVLNNLSAEVAFSLEVAAIEQYGRKDLGVGCLANLTDGGDGAFGFSDDMRKQIGDSRRGKYVGPDNHNYGKPLSESTRKKITESLIGRFAGENSPSYGRRHTEEEKRKIGDSGKGRPAWNKGLTVETDERVRKYVGSQIGKVVPEEQRKQISNTLIGYKHNNEAKINMSKGQKEKAWVSDERREQARTRGKSEERRQILQKAVHKRWESEKARDKASSKMKGANNPFYGKTHSPKALERMRIASTNREISDETREKLRQAANRRWKKTE